MKLRKVMAAVVAAGMLAGCTVSAPGYEAGTGIPTEVTVPQVTEPAQVRYAFGDIVYSLEPWDDGTVQVCRHAVVAHEGDVIMITTAVSDTSAALRECLPEYLAEGAAVRQLDEDDAYATEREAEAAAAEMMGGCGQ